MDYNELQQTLVDLDHLTYMLEQQYVENEGECTAETDAMEKQIEGLKDLLAGDGLDMLGAWLRSKEDRVKALKAEKDYISRQMAALEESMDFIKSKVTEVMDMTGMEKTEKSKRGYSFSRTESVTTSIDKDVLKALYQEEVQAALTAAHIPCYIGVTLSASSSKYDAYGSLREGDDEIFNKVVKQTVRFSKPRETKK